MGSQNAFSARLRRARRARHLGRHRPAQYRRAIAALTTLRFCWNRVGGLLRESTQERARDDTAAARMAAEPRISRWVDRMAAAGLTEPLRLGTRSRHGRWAPRGAPLHGGRQQQIRGSVPSHGARVLEVRIHLPPAVSQVRTAIGPAELPVAPRKQAQGAILHRGTEGSNPPPSSGESTNFRFREMALRRNRIRWKIGGTTTTITRPGMAGSRDPS
jgi:hypothetical protein